MTDVETSLADSIERAALTWLIRLQDPTFEEWDDWEQWLTRDPRHADAYWRLADADAALVDPVTARPAVAAQLRRAHHRRATAPRLSRPKTLAAGIAAAVVLACGLYALTLGQAPQVFETGPGEIRRVVLADGTTAHLAGSTRLEMTSADRRVRLETGRALFEVTHDADQPFTVLVEEAEIVDLGTVFDVTRLQTGIRVAVAEGEVRFDGRAGSERLNAGQGLVATTAGVVRHAFDPVEVSGWRDGRLSYRGATLSEVGEDLSRALGWPVQVPASLATRPFTGSLDTTGERGAVRRRVQTLLGVSVIEADGAWRLAPATGAP